MKFSVFHPMVHFGDDTLDIAQLYEESLAITQLAEELGFESFFYNEGHKNHPNFRLPNPRMMIAAAAQRTSKIKLGTGLTITTYNDPKLVTEDAAMLDALTHGRFVFGLGSGFDAMELVQFGIDPNKRKALSQVNENIILGLLAAKVQNQKINIRSEFVNTHDTEVSIPVDPTLRRRIYKGTIYEESCYDIGKQGMGLMLSVTDLILDDSASFYKRCIAKYHEGWAASTFAQNTPPDIYTMTIVHPSVSDEESAEFLPFYISRYKDKGDKKTTLPSCGSFYEHFLNDPMVLVGGIERVREKVEFMRDLGVSNVLGIMNTGGIPNEHVKQAMELVSNNFIASAPAAAEIPLAKTKSHAVR